MPEQDADRRAAGQPRAGQHRRRSTPRQATRVLPIELFLDLAFVFTITQLTALISHAPSWQAVAQALLVGVVLWWMFDGYTWLTNAVPPTTATLRALLIAAMAAYLVLALTVPFAFGADGIAFGLAYLAVVLIHLVTFQRATRAQTVRAMVQVGIFNVSSALVVLAAGFVTGAADWVLWTLAVLIDLAAGLYGRGRSRFTMAAAHFAERHGLLLLIALGESVVAVAIGLSGRPVNWSLALTVALGLLVVGGLFWCYFADDESVVRAYAARPDHERPTLALTAFGVGHFVMIFGVVLLAAGIEGVISEVSRAGRGADPLLISGGVALFLAGDALFTNLLRVRRPHLRLVAVLVAGLAWLLGTGVSELAQLLLLGVVLAALPFTETWVTRRTGTARSA